MNFIANFFSDWSMQIIDIIRLIGSCLCGFLIGYERQERIRQRHMRSAGLRTHMLVAVASAAMMLISKYGFMDMLVYGNQVSVDVSRVAASIVSGVGFIGAGIIFVRRDNIMGLTTAAGLWATAAVGMAIGAGMYVCGITLTILILVVQEMNRLPMYQHAKNRDITITWRESPGMAETVLDWMSQNNVEIRSVCSTRMPNGEIQMQLRTEIGEENGRDVFLKLLDSHPEIVSVEF